MERKATSESLLYRAARGEENVSRQTRLINTAATSSV